MKKLMELLKKIIGIPDGHTVRQNESDELKKVRSSIMAMQIIALIFMVIMLIFSAVWLIDCVTDLYEYSANPSFGLAKALCISISDFILCGSLFFISILCKNIFASINQSGTPFIPQVSSGMKKIAAVIAVMLILSAAAEYLFPMVFPVLNTEPELVTDPAGWIFFSLLLMLSNIFDYGCKLQQESDETL
ncbi:MAG: DUF2975 domain-containing protein [Oscillospiraceae bacterium]|nr:DUF2975 domain-containing protein [Oscillospiraceae bacterium]